MAANETEAPEGPEYVVVLAGPKTPGNVGSVARAMANFGVRELRVTGDLPMDTDAYRLAFHAGYVLDRARRFASFEEALEGLDVVVGTTGIINVREKRHLRNPMTPAELKGRVASVRGRVGLVFGREDYGLFDEELERCDMLVTIPTGAEYPVMNLSHAVAVVLYELHRDRRLSREATVADEGERDRLLAAFDELFETTRYPKHKLKGTRIMVRRIIGRATLSKWEYHTLIGVIKRPSSQLRHLREDMRAAGVEPSDGRKAALRGKRKRKKRQRARLAAGSEGKSP